MQSILVTGATGFLGSAVVAHLQRSGVKIRSTGRSANPSCAAVEFHRADLTDERSLGRLCAGMDCVIHVAGLAHQFRPAADTRRQFYAINTAVARNLAQAAARAGVQHFVLISSMSVYGSQSAGPRREEDDCLPDDDYARSKYAAELHLTRVAESHQMRLTILRPATIYGEHDVGNLLRLIEMIEHGRFVWIGDGRNHKSLIHRDDAARVCALAAERSGGRLVEIYNVSSPSCAMREIVETIARRLRRRIAPLRVPIRLIVPAMEIAARLAPTSNLLSRVHETLHKWRRDDVLCTHKFNDHFAFQPQVSLEEGLSREVDWFLQERRSRSQRRTA